ncbi:hypothetical protein [Arthrobacter sp. ok909]|uniref:hypothetical protein n=1 Tax=Arthrobacter sp. ok909 TaxID=1761746 RepID=UPI001C31A611|nr:hypothetical protein [Arthrobacter sp. ok909]
MARAPGTSRSARTRWQQIAGRGAGQGSSSWLTTPQLAAYVRVEVRHPMTVGTPSDGTAMGTTLRLGPMAALTNPIFLGTK